MLCLFMSSATEIPLLVHDSLLACMDKQRLTQTVQVWLLYFKTRPYFFFVITCVLVSSTVLYITIPWLFTSFTIAAIVIVVVNGSQRCVASAFSSQRQSQSKETLSTAMSSTAMSTQQECCLGFAGDGWEGNTRPPCMDEGNSPFPCREEQAFSSGVIENWWLISPIVMGPKDEAMEETGLSGEEAHGNAVLSVHRCDKEANYGDGEGPLDSKRSPPQPSNGADVPDLEDCSTISEVEDEVCKGVLEGTSLELGPLEDTILEGTSLELGSLEDTNLSDSILQSSRMKATAAVADDSIDKHQILPPASCINNECRSDTACEELHKCPGVDSEQAPKGCMRRKLVITDAELQKASSEFYTLEGDVLWSKSADLSKKPSYGKRRGATSASDIWAAAWYQSPSSGTFSSFSSRAQGGGGHMLPAMPAISKVFSQVESEAVGKSAEMQQVINQDVLLDAELRAIAFRSAGNRGEESNYMSTAGSFRDIVESFREAEAYWAEYGDMKEEDAFAGGCCDDHAKPCISHSRSRSKVLQSDPLLSKASLKREQEIMDVLWQDHNVAMRRQKHKDKEGDGQKQREGMAHACSTSSGDAEELPDDGDEYVIKLNAMPSYDRNSSSHCRLGCDRTCWHIAKARGHHRRRHFVRICRVLREFGLKQCMQSSTVDN